MREAVLPRSKMWTLPHYPELPTHTWGLLSGKRENITLHPLHPSTPLDHATLPTPYRYPAQANQGWLRLVLAIRLPLDAPGYTRCACALPCLALGIAPPHARQTLLSVGLAKTSLRQARSLKRKQSGGTD